MSNIVYGRMSVSCIRQLYLCAREEPNLAADYALGLPDGATPIGAWSDDMPVGGVFYVRDRPIRLHHRAHLRGLYVLPAYRSARIARELMERAVQHAADAGVTCLFGQTTADNKAAERLLEAMGWTFMWLERGGLQLPNADVNHWVLYT